MLTNTHDVPAEGNSCNEEGMGIRVTEWQTVTPSAIGLPRVQRIVLSSVRPGHSQQLHSSFLLWGKKI